MTALARLQQRFLASLLDGSEAALPLLAPDRQLSARLGWSIYANAYTSRLREVLENDHPMLALYLGNPLWERLCDDFVAARPSRLTSLRHFGNPLPAWLRQAAPFDALPQVAELAAWERRLMDSFDAAGAPTAGWEPLTVLPPDQWPTLRLVFQPSLQSLQLGWNSVAIWKALKSGQAPPEAVQAADGFWAIWRDASLLTRYRPMTSEESLLIELFRHGGNFGDACATLLRWHPPGDVPQRALHWLKQWTAEGWISAWEATPPRPLPDRRRRISPAGDAAG